MKSLYITSIERFSGKTALCLGLGRRFQTDGLKVGYLKPLSLQPTRDGEHLADADAAFVKQILGLEKQPWELSPVVFTDEFLRERLSEQAQADLVEQVKFSCQVAGEGQDLLILEGSGSMREGYAFGLGSPAASSLFADHSLAIVRYRDDLQVLDDPLAAQDRIENLAGILINRVPAQASGYVSQTIAPYLEKQGITVFGVLPEMRSLAALTVGELVDTLGAEVVTRFYRPQALVQNLTVGAMEAETALPHFRQYPQKAVITGGDRTDIQLVALETSTTCLILTGNLQPKPLVVKQAEEFGVAVLMVPGDTMETIEAIERRRGKTHLSQPAKLRQFETLLNQHVNFNRLYEKLGIQR